MKPNRTNNTRRRDTAFALAATFAVAAPFAFAPHARAQASKVPGIGAPRAVVLPKITQDTLANGLRLVVLEDHTQPALWAQLAIPAGSIRDPKEKIGLAAMTASLLDKGTTSRSESQIADTIDRLGATLGAGADDDTLTISARGLSRSADTVMDLLADITLRPTFPDAEIARYRTRTLSAIQSALADPAQIAEIAAARLVYGAHPYGNFSLGLPTTVPGITQADLKAFHSMYFTPNGGATLFVVGDITPVQAKAQAERVFGKWLALKGDVDPMAYPIPPTPSGSRPTITIIDVPGTEQVQVRIGTLTGPYNAPDRIAARVASVVLGEGQFEGRLMQEIRVKRGLTYGAGAGFQRLREAGNFTINTFTKNETVGETVKIALDEARKIATQTVPADELADRKTYLAGGFAVRVATPDGLLARLIPAVLYGSGPDEVAQYVSQIEATTPQQIQAALAALPLGTPQIVLVGDASKIRVQAEAIGDVRVIARDAVDFASPTLQGAAPSPTTPAVVTGAEATEGKALLTAVVKAHGGDAFANLKTLKITGKGTLTPPGGAAGQTLPIDGLTLYSALPDKSRLELQTGFGEIATIAQGGTKAGVVIFGGNASEQPARDTFAADPTLLLREAASGNLPVRVVSATDTGKPDGKAITDTNKPGGKALKAFEITDGQKRVVRYYVEADTNIVRRTSYTSSQGKVDILLGGYKAFGGIQLPTTFVISAGGSEFVNLTFSAVEVNPTLADSLFVKP